MDVTAVILIFAVFFLCLVISMPIAIVMGWAALVYLLMMPSSKFILMLPSGMFQGIDSFVLMAVPFFMLAGQLMNTCGLTDKLVSLADALAGNVRGSLAHANAIGSFLFAGISGSAVADVAALGTLEIKAMKKQGYDEAFSAALTATTSLIGPIIPPSIIIVIYGSIMGVSIAGLFAAGILPGVLFLFVTCGYVAWISKRRNYPRSDEPFSLRRIGKAFKEGSPTLGMPAIIIGGILGGIFTPTEAAAVAVFYALLLGGPVYRKLDLRTLGMNVLTAGIQSSLIFLIIATAISFKWVLAVLNVPAAILGFLESFYQNPWVAITLVNIFFLIVGLFFELGAAVILFGPIFAPAMVKMGFDPLHFGIIMIVNLVIGLCTPPVGVCLYATCSVCDASLEDLCREVWPIILLYIGVLAFITYFPYLTLWLPRALGF